MIRRFGESPEAGRKYIHRAGVYAILPQGSSLLLTCQADPGPDLQLPGGGIDPGESPITALHREVFEETGWRIARPLRIGAFRRFVYMPEYDMWADKICHIYHARPVARLGPPSEEGHEAIWMEAIVAAQMLGNPGDRHFALEFALSGSRPD
ncbi:NUDIX hydrolase [Primorskyibacter sp. S87]|uniref:NUDIX hydrolase n=1 Tax=Primorskyibacter sp. S87 TaxID=3415126 RepID=UPI003C7E6A3D